MKNRITEIIERWFLQEPAMFAAVCTHNFVANTKISCPMRIGGGKIEFNPVICEELDDKSLEVTIMIEAIRILLKHPYERKPVGCGNYAIAVGSNLTIGDNYRNRRVKLERPEDFQLGMGCTYEWYSLQIQQRGEKNGAKYGIGVEMSLKSEISELWDEDPMMISLINEKIESIREWGTLAGTFAEQIIASTKGKINWKDVFGGLRASILSSKRKLTRMRPNRRTGFLNMGCIRRFDTKLLVAVDVSGSISIEILHYFYGVVNSAFRYGFDAVDVIQFDVGVTTVQSISKKIRNVTAIGRGGTSFEEPIQYAFENRYDGMVILTDGYAPEPVLPKGFTTKILWVCEDLQCYNAHHTWMEKSGRVCIMDIN